MKYKPTQRARRINQQLSLRRRIQRACGCWMVAQARNIDSLQRLSEKARDSNCNECEEVQQ